MSWTPRSRTSRHRPLDAGPYTSVHAQFDRVLDALADKLPKVAEHLEHARADVLGLHHPSQGGLAANLVEQPQRAAQPEDPPAHRCGGIFPDRDALIRLVGVVLGEQHDEWTEGRCHLGLDVLARCRLRPLAADGQSTEAEEVAIPALSA